jgi:hypothetical protein
MTDDDKFFERLRGDAQMLRHQPDEATLARIRARIHARIARPSVAELLAAWFRPLAATALAVVLAAAVGVAAFDDGDVTLDDSTIEISVGGETYRVAE